MSRDPHAPADRWRSIAPGVWFREAVSARSPSALVRSQRAGAFVMRIGNDGPWLAAGDTLAAATEHAGGHAARVERDEAVAPARSSTRSPGFTCAVATK